MAVPEVRELIYTVKDLVARVAALEARALQTPTSPAAIEPLGYPTVYVYALCEPETEEVRYVGQTTNPTEQLKDHRQMKDQSAAKNLWVQGLPDRGSTPIMRILEEVPPEDGAIREAFWIERCRGEGARLLNVSAALPIQPYRAPAPAQEPAGTLTPGSIEQWTVRLSKALIQRIKAEAAAADKPPSHLLEELAW